MKFLLREVSSCYMKEIPATRRIFMLKKIQKGLFRRKFLLHEGNSCFLFLVKKEIPGTGTTFLLHEGYFLGHVCCKNKLR